MKAISSLLYLFVLVSFAFLYSCSNGYIKAGDKEYNNLSYSKAISKYKKALRGQPENPELKLKLANSYTKLNKPEMAENLYRQVADSMELPPAEMLNYAQVLMKNNKYEEAVPFLNSYLKQAPNDQLALDLLASIQHIEELKEDTSAYMLDPLPLDFTVSMFGPAHYGKGLVFSGETEIVSAASTNPWTGYSFLDLFYMEKDGAGNWDVPSNFSSELNGKFHDGPAVFSKDQKKIIYTRSAMKNEKKQLVNEDNENQFYLYSSDNIEGKWSEPKELPFNNQAYSVGHPTLSDDGKTLYFSSNMPGGYGGSDLYKSSYDGIMWGEPINLGKTINTAGNEVFPSLGNDGKLYFSSQGHLTLGGLDVFVTENRAGAWSAPINLAYPLNSSQDDFAIIFNEDDSTGFVSSDRSGTDMIYAFTRIPPALVVDGMASLKATGLPIKDVAVILVNLSDVDSAKVTTREDGKFKFNLLPSKEYRITGTKDGYFTVSENFETGKTAIEKNIELKFEIDEIVASNTGSGSGKPGDGSETAAKTYDIGEVFYDYNDATIRTDAKPTLNKLVTLLNDNPKISIEVQSHCDSRGQTSYNLELSNRRAQSVVNYLISSGINKARVQAKGFGESQLVNNCIDGVQCSAAEHQKNRRTEFIVLKDNKL